MPVIRYQLRPNKTQADVDALTAAINAATPAGVIPRATVINNGSGGPPLVEVGLPVGIAANDLANAEAAVNGNAGVAFSGTFPSIVADENFDGLALGNAPASLVNNGWVMSITDQTKFQIVDQSIVLNGAGDGAVLAAGRRLSVSPGATTALAFFSVPQMANTKTINKIGAWAFSCKMITQGWMRLGTDGGYSIVVSSLGAPQFQVLVQENMNQDINNDFDGLTNPGGIFTAGITPAGDLYAKMDDGDGNVGEATLSLGFLPQVNIINMEFGNSTITTLDDLSLTINSGA